MITAVATMDRLNDEEIDAVLRKALENLRSERAAGRFDTVTLLVTSGTVEQYAARLERLGATASELASLRLDLGDGYRR